MRCSYCPQDLAGKVYDGPRLMTVETFLTALGNLPKGIPLSFAGLSEPYINKATSSMVIAAAALGRKFHIYTTGVGMSDADVHTILSLPLGRLQRLVFHLPDGDGDMKASVTPQYVARLRTLFRLVKGTAAVHAVCFGSLHPELAEFAGFLRGDNVQTRAGNVTTAKVHLTTPKQKYGPLGCAPAPELKNNVMLPNGDLIICCQDYGLRHVIGNMLTQTWDEIHASPKMAEFKALMAGNNGKGDCLCRTCEYAEIIPLN